MCNITILPPGTNIPFPKIQNVVWNNPHGWGGVLKDNGKLEVRKFFNEKGTDPEEVARWLDDNKDIERVFHVRWQTEGAINKENVQPFDCYYTDKIHIVGAHNGTLYDYKGNDNRSDSRRFFEDLASPLVTRFGGDIHDELFVHIVNKFFGNAIHNKGILINSAADHLLLNKKEWCELKIQEGTFVTSNLEYFHELKRGFMYEQRKKEKEEKERAAPVEGSLFRQPAKASEINFGYKHDLKADIGQLLEEVGQGNTEGLVALSNLKEQEVARLVVDKPNTAKVIFLHLTSELRRSVDAYNSLEQKHEKASNMIAELRRQVG